MIEAMSDDAVKTPAADADGRRRAPEAASEVSPADAGAADEGEGDAEGESDEAGRSPRRTGRRRGRPSRARGRPLSSDEAAFRWTVRGVPVHVRALALKAAEERGMTVGDWLAEAIVAFSRSGAPGGTGGPAPEARTNLPATETPPDLMEMVRGIDRRLTALEEQRSPGFFSRLFGGRRRQT